MVATKSLLSAAALILSATTQLAGADCPTAPAENGLVHDCYPPVDGKPNVTEELCLAQDCCWHEEHDIPCRFGSKPAPSLKQCSAVTPQSRLPCRNPAYYIPVASAEQCETMGCCWDSAADPKTFVHCYQPASAGYEVMSMNPTDYGFKGELHLPAGASGPFGNDIQQLEIQVYMETAQRLRVKIIDPTHARYEVPGIVDSALPTTKPEQTDYEFGYTSAPFGFSVVRKATGEVLFNSTPTAEAGFNGMAYSNQYLEISTQLPSTKEQPLARIYGLGEEVGSLRLQLNSTDGQHYTYFARDNLAGFSEHTSKGGNNVYGVQPFYMRLEDDGNAHGVFLLNSNALEVLGQSKSITYRSVGGILDFFFFMGSSAPVVVEQFTELVGRPILPPYWAMGFHLCKWGYFTAKTTRSVVERMREAGVPQDVQWNDIDYMDQHAVFTLDPEKFSPKEMREFIDDLHAHDQYYVNIHDPGVSLQYEGDYNFTIYKRLMEMGAYVQDRHGHGHTVNERFET